MAARIAAPKMPQTVIGRRVQVMPRARIVIDRRDDVDRAHDRGCADEHDAAKRAPSCQCPSGRRVGP